MKAMLLFHIYQNQKLMSLPIYQKLEAPAFEYNNRNFYFQFSMEKVYPLIKAINKSQVASEL